METGKPERLEIKTRSHAWSGNDEARLDSACFMEFLERLGILKLTPVKSIVQYNVDI